MRSSGLRKKPRRRLAWRYFCRVKGDFADADGKVEFLDGFILDITEQRDQRRNLETANAELVQSRKHILSMMEDAEAARKDAAASLWKRGTPLIY